MQLRCNQGLYQRSRTQVLSLGFLTMVAALPCTAAPAPISREQLQSNILLMQQLVAACQTTSSACVATHVSGDSIIPATGNSPAFYMNWDWLRIALESAAKAKPSDRADTLAAASARLSELNRQIISPDSANNFPKVRTAAQQVLSRAEFQENTGPSWISRQLAKLSAFFALIFNRAGRLGETAPWLGPTVEVLLYLGAAVGILYFVRRALVRQRLAVSIGGGALRASSWDKGAEDWSALADTCADNQQWRDAVHCLYWAAIVRLEAARAWRHNPTRTPREYVRLLKPGSTQQVSLRTLTHVFERVWYGLREASDTDYQQARALFESLSHPQQQQPTAEAA